MSITFSPALGILVFCVLFVSFFIKGLAGFGDPLISNPLLSMRLDNKLISPMNLILATPLNAYLAWKNRKSFSAKTALPIVAAMLCGIIPGTFLLKYGSSWILKSSLGLLVIGIGIEMLLRNRSKPVKTNMLIMILVSFVSGITAGLYGINLFFVAYIERTTTKREAFRANMCFIFLIENISRIIVYTFTGVFTVDILKLVLIALPGTILGFFTGTRVDTKLSEPTIRHLIIGLFMLGGISILIKALGMHFISN